MPWRMVVAILGKLVGGIVGILCIVDWIPAIEGWMVEAITGC